MKNLVSGKNYLQKWQFFTLLTTVLSSPNRKSFDGRLFCDLQKAFGCVKHDTLVAKMEFYGITGTANKLMRSYSENRFHSINLFSVYPYTGKVPRMWKVVV